MEKEEWPTIRPQRGSRLILLLQRAVILSTAKDLRLPL
jgi:hypothetical protein